MNKYIILIKNVHQIVHLEGIFHILFTSEGAHPPKTTPFEGCIQVTGKIQNYWEKETNKKYIYFNLKKERATNQQNRPI